MPLKTEAKTGEKRPAMYHVLTNTYLEFVDKDHARLEAYWMTVFAAVDNKPGETWRRPDARSTNWSA